MSKGPWCLLRLVRLLSSQLQKESRVFFLVLVVLDLAVVCVPWQCFPHTWLCVRVSAASGSLLASFMIKTAQPFYPRIHCFVKPGHSLLFVTFVEVLQDKMPKRAN